MLLSNLTKTINITKTYNYSSNKFFSSITSNSKYTNESTIFIYDKNSKVKKQYIDEALLNKIPAIISNKYLKFISIPQFIVSNINAETEILLSKIYKNKPKKTIAITGTNGKTSVVWYISQILNLLNYNNITVGTLGYFSNGKKLEDINLTTPAYEEFYRYGNSSKKNSIYIFEASSHALDQNRIRNYPIDIAAITNISNDHLDYHKTFKEYKKTKLKLFTKHLSEKGIAIFNSRLKKFNLNRKNIKDKNLKLIYFGHKYISLKKKNKYYILRINNNTYSIKKLNQNTKLELENLECAITCCLALNLSKSKVIKILSKIINPPGRLQALNYTAKKSKIIIDYAHTPDALEKILISLSSGDLKPVLLFGCGGDRDKTKRKMMGIIAKKYASKIYITDDNPRNENPNFIRKSIIKYCPNAIEIADRKKAIRRAIKDLNMNQILIIAGKGHERVQIIKNKEIKFDDFQIVKDCIKYEN